MSADPTTAPERGGPTATFAYHGEIAETTLDTLHYLTEPFPVVGDHRVPQIDPRDLGSDGRHARHDLTMGLRPAEGAPHFTEDHLTGYRVFVRDQPTTQLHTSYEEPWGVNLSNDFDPSDGARVPWDHGLTAPRVAEPFVF